VVDISHVDQPDRAEPLAPPRVDFPSTKAAALANARTLVPEWLSGGRFNGREYVCAGINGGKGRSFSVNVETGKWSEFNGGDLKGGDLISLYAAINGLSQGEAARVLAERLAIDSSTSSRPRASKPAPPVVMPVPDDAGSPDFTHFKYGRPSQTWTYHDASGRVLQHVARYDLATGGKQIIPWTWNGTSWQMKHPSAPRPLYGLDRSAANPDAPVILTEGEKAADAAQHLFPGAVTMTWSGGSNAVGKADWTSLQDREVIIWPDADAAGHKAAQGVADAIGGIAASIRTLDVGDRPDKWDAADALADGWTVTDATEFLADAEAISAFEPLKLIDPTALEGLPIPEFKWLLEDWIPWGYVTALYGDGGTGKSLLAQQLMTVIATGKSFFGIPTTSCRVLGYFCEDKDDEIHRRQWSVNAAVGVPFRDLGRTRWVSRVGEENILIEFIREGTGCATKAYEQLRTAALEIGAQFIVLDTAADLFGGNENARPQVRQFINLLARLANEINGAVLLCAHPSASGISSGEGSGGSTAWNNTVRSRLYLKGVEADGGEPDDEVDDLRILTRKKANYARRGDEITLRWKDWAFELVSASNAKDTISRIEQANREREIDQAFLDGLDKLHGQGRNVSESPYAKTYAPKMIASLPNCRYRVRELTAAMERLFDEGTIEVGEIGTTKHRKKQVGVRRAEMASNPQETGEN